MSSVYLLPMSPAVQTRRSSRGYSSRRGIVCVERFQKRSHAGAIGKRAQDLKRVRSTAGQIVTESSLCFGRRDAMQFRIVGEFLVELRVDMSRYIWRFEFVGQRIVRPPFCRWPIQPPQKGFMADAARNRAQPAKKCVGAGTKRRREAAQAFNGDAYPPELTLGEQRVVSQRNRHRIRTMLRSNEY